MKTCSKCGETKAVSEFSKCRSRKDGLQAWCKACERAHYKANREKRLEQVRDYHQANKEKIAEKSRAYREANKEKIAEQKRAHYQANREAKLEYQRAYQKSNKDKIAEYKRAHKQANKGRIAAYHKKRLTEDPAFAMVVRLRNRLNNVLNGRAKAASTMELVGCSPEKLCAWLEMHFDEGMTWENRSEWHIDHIRPIASFEDPADPACWHWSNLQPLWAKDNLRKGARV